MLRTMEVTNNHAADRCTISIDMERIIRNFNDRLLKDTKRNEIISIPSPSTQEEVSKQDKKRNNLISAQSSYYQGIVTQKPHKKSITTLEPTFEDDRITMDVHMARYNDSLRQFCKDVGIDHHIENLRTSGCNSFVGFFTFRVRGDDMNNFMRVMSQIQNHDLAFRLNVDGGDGEMRMKATNSFSDNIRTSGIEDVDLIPDHVYEVRILAADIYRNDVSSPAMIGIFSIVHLSEDGRRIEYTALNYEWGHDEKMPNRKHRKAVLLDTSFVIPEDEDSPPGVIGSGIFRPLCGKVISEINPNDNLPATGDRERRFDDRLSKSGNLYVEHVPDNKTKAKVMIRFRFRTQRPVVYPVSDVDRSTELTRLHSFRIWQYNNIMSSTGLVEAGFYQERDRSKITCVECRVSVDVASLTTDVLRWHRQCSPECSFATRTSHELNASNEGNLADGITRNGSGVVVDTTHNLDTTSHEHSSYLHGSSIEAVSHNNTSSDYIRTCGSANQQQNNFVKDNILGNIQGSDGSRNPTSEPGPTLVYTPQSSGNADPSVRESTFWYWNNRNRFQDTGKLVDAGFYFAGNGDAVRCFSCDIGLADWKPHNDPWVEHARHSPLCSYLISHKGQEFINGVQEAWRRVYTPRHRRFVEVAERLRSFENAGWPADYVRQTPEELAEAGFFYKGERDTVRCHYCDGGLRDLEPEDDPWVEHGRWFSFCKYVIEKKGIEFIRECATGNGSRPATNMPQINSSNLPKAYSTDAPEALLKENEVMKNQFTCMNCKVKDRTNVFLPCGHRLMCDPCARQQTKCCHCDTAVTDTVITFLS